MSIFWLQYGWEELTKRFDTGCLGHEAKLWLSLKIYLTEAFGQLVTCGMCCGLRLSPAACRGHLW